MQSTSIHSPLPARLSDSRREINNERFSTALPQIQSEIDWIVPSTKEEVSNRLNTLNLFKYKIYKNVGRRTVGERLKPTLDIAIIEKDKYTAKAKWTGFTLNAAIGMQVLLGSLTTGLSALAVSGGISVNIF